MTHTWHGKHNTAAVLIDQRRPSTNSRYSGTRNTEWGGVGKVIEQHPEHNTVDVAEFGGYIYRDVQVGSPRIGSAGGEYGIVPIVNTSSLASDAGSLDSPLPSGRDTYAVLLFPYGRSKNPIVVCYLAPDVFQQGFENIYRWTFKHPKAGGYEMNEYGDWAIKFTGPNNFILGSQYREVPLPMGNLNFDQNYAPPGGGPPANLVIQANESRVAILLDKTIHVEAAPGHSVFVKTVGAPIYLDSGNSAVIIDGSNYNTHTHTTNGEASGPPNR